MKKEVNIVKYYCDLCKKEVKDETMLIKDLTILGIKKVKVDANTVRSSIVRVKHQDICAECAGKLASIITVNDKNQISFVQKSNEAPKKTVTTKTQQTVKTTAKTPTTKTSVSKTPTQTTQQPFKTRELPNTRDMVTKQHLKITKPK